MIIRYYVTTYKQMMERGKKKLEPIPVVKSEASYQNLMLDMMSKLTRQMHENNDILRKYLLRDEQGGLYTQSANKRTKSNSNDFKVNQSPNLNKKLTYQEEEKQIQEQARDFVQFKASHNQSFVKNASEEKISIVLEKLAQNMQFNQKIQEKLLEKLSNEHYIDQDKQPKMNNNHIGREEYQKNRQIVEKQLFAKVEKNFKKKNSMVLQQILPHSDRRQFKIKFKLSDVIDVKKSVMSASKIYEATAEWLGNVYRATASICWNTLTNGILSFQQIKVLFTQNIVFNYIEFMNELRTAGISAEGLTALINEKSIYILDFLCTQYPQTKIEAPNMAIRDILPPIENQGRLEYDLISLSGVTFNYNQSKDYTSNIMRVINFLISASNDQFDNFKICMEGIFNEVFVPANKRRTQFIPTQEDFAFKEAAKRYTHYKIGRKIPKNTKMYTDQEIQDGIFFVNSTSVLRIITKWVQELYEYFQESQTKIKNSYDQRKDHFGRSLYLSSVLKNAIYLQFNKHRKELEKRIQQIKNQCYVMEWLLTAHNFIVDPAEIHLSQQQISVGKYCSNLKTSISAYLCSQLNEIIHMLLDLPRRINETTIFVQQKSTQKDYSMLRSKARRTFDKVNLVTARIFDLLRCYCNSNQQQIIWILKVFLQKNKDYNDPFQIVRIKDRLNQGTRDVLINARIGTGLVCQIQLSVTSQSDKKQEQLNMYNHFLYELKRSNLGPLTENVSIWATLEQRFTYFEKLRGVQRRKIVQMDHKCTGELKSFTRPIICATCQTFYAIPQSCLLNYKCNQCALTYCGECYYNAIGPMEKKRLLFGKRILTRQVLENIVEYSDPKTPFPINGFFVKKHFLKKQLSFYMATLKSGKKDQNSQNQQLMVVQTIIRKQGIVNRQIHRKTIYVQVKNSKLYIKNYQKTELNQLLIFHFPQLQNKKLINLNGIEAFLTDPINENTRILSIIKEPSYIADLKMLLTPLQKSKEIKTIRDVINDDKVTAYFFKNLIVLAQACVRGTLLRENIGRKNNIKILKQFALKQSDIVSMEDSNITTQFDLLPQKLSSIELKNLYTIVKKLFLSTNKIISLQSIGNLCAVEFFVISGNELVSLKGIQQMKNLKSIRFDDNRISDLQALSPLTELQSLSGDRNLITSLEGIRNSKKLHQISLCKNNIETLEPILALSELHDCQIRDNPLLSLEGIQKNKELICLQLSKSLIKDMKPLAFLQKLKLLSLGGLMLGCIPPIFKNIKLNQLSLHSNGIRKIQNLETQDKLTLLNLKNNQIQDLSSIQYIVNLQSLKIDRNKIKVVKGIKKLQHFRHLNIRDNPIENVGELNYLEYGFSIKYSVENVVLKEFYKQLQQHQAIISEEEV